MNTNNDANRYPSPFAAWGTVCMLSITYMFSFMDRQILVLLIDAIKEDLQISDTEVSLLTGLAFAVVYTVMSMPMGRLADLWVRKYVIIIGVTIWSLLTIASGFAKNFLQLFLTRMGVGLGEAGLTAPAYAIVSDLFPPSRLAFPMSVFVMGASIGGSLALLLGGVVVGFAEGVGTINIPLLGELAPWRLVLVIAGVASLLIVIPLLLIKEPKRQTNTVTLAPPGETDKTATESHLSFSEILRYMRLKRNFYYPFVTACSISYLAGYGAAVWLPSYFIRVMGMEASEVGITLGIVTLIPLMTGGILAGKLVDWLYIKGYRDASLRLMTVLKPILLVMLVAVIYLPGKEIKFASMAGFYFFAAMYSAVQPTVMQMATPSPIRSQVSAIILFAMNMSGLGLGATAIALITDFVFHDELAVGDSIIVVAVFAYGISTLLFYKTIKPFSKQLKEVMDE